MPFLSPTVTFTRYMVTDALPDNFWENALDAISSRCFREGAAGVQEMSAGWASAREPFKEEITMEDIGFSDYLLLSLRVDKRSVPASLLKKMCSIEERRVMQERQLNRLASRMRKEIRERIRLQLLAKSLPVPSLHDMVWNISTGSVLFFSRQDKICGLLEDMFKTTFGMPLKPVIPYTLGLSLIDPEAGLQAYEQIRPEALV